MNPIALADAKRLPLAGGTVHCVVTSPPFWALRRYPEPNSIGHEPTFEEHVRNILQVFAELWRVLRDDGTVWMEYGDSWAANQVQLLPFRVVMALQEVGWYLRSVCIWHKPNAMPESVRNRPAASHSYIFLLTKRATGYYYDVDAERTPLSEGSRIRLSQPTFYRQQAGPKDGINPNRSCRRAIENLKASGSPGAALRTVWTIATEPLPLPHYAAFPTELARRCISLGTSAKGVCPKCGKQWARLMEIRGGRIGKGWSDHSADQTKGSSQVYRCDGGPTPYERKHLCWRPSCDCPEVPPIPALVLDPFAGTGTTLAVARSMGRRAIGFEIAEEYCKIAQTRKVKQRYGRQMDWQPILFEV